MFLAALGAEERARFDALPAPTRAKHLEMLRHGGDPVILAHVMATLRPPRPRSPIPTPEDPVRGLLESLASGIRTPRWPWPAGLAREFGDRGSYRYYSRSLRRGGAGQSCDRESRIRVPAGDEPEGEVGGESFVHAVKVWDARHGASQM